MAKVKKEPNNSASKAAGETFARKDGTPPYLAQLMKDNRATINHVADYLNRGCDPNQPDETGKTPIQIAIDRHWLEAALMLKQAGAVPPKFDGNAEGDPNLPYVAPPRTDGWSYDDRAEKKEIADNTAFGYYVRKMARVELIISALVNGADVNLKSDGDSPLEITQQYRDGGEWPWLATQLVKLGAWRNPDNPDPNETVNQTTGATRLLALILEGKDYRAVERTLMEGADPDKPDKTGLTPLAAALAVNWPGVEQLLIKHGAKQDVALPDPDQLVGKSYNDDDKKPLLTYAMYGGNMNSNFFRSLLEGGANPDFAGPNGMTTGYIACVRKCMWHLDELHAFGADFTIPEKNGMTPLGIACYNNNLDVVKWLDGKIPDEQFTMKTGQGGWTPLHYAVCRPDCEQLVTFLLSKGADPNAVNDKGETPMQVAAEHKGTGKAMKLLVEASAATQKLDVNARDAKGRTALDAALDHSTPDPKMVRYLLDQGADVKLLFQGDDKNNHSLFTLLALGWHDEDQGRLKAQLEVLQMLADAGVDFNVKATYSINNAQKGDTLVHYAARYSKLEILEFLLDHGADIYGTAHNGKSMAHEFIGWHKTKGMELLLDKGFDPLKHWDFTENWSNGPHAHSGTILDEVRMLYLSDKHYKREKETQPLLDLIEGHLKAKGIDTDAIPYPKMLAPTYYEHQEALGKKLKAEQEAREAAIAQAKPALKPR